MSKNYIQLVTKIERFIRKYYANLLIKGAILSIFLLSLLFLLLSTVEHFAYMRTILRLVVFYTYLSIGLYVLVRYILIPVYKLVTYRKSMTLEEAAREIGRHFPDVEDKLLNTIQLKNLSASANADAELLGAAIDYKTRQLNPIAFTRAVNLKRNWRYVRYALMPVMVLLLLVLVFPSFIAEPAKRIVDYNTAYAKPLPYQLNIENASLDALQHDDFELVVKAIGDEFPEKVSLETGGFSYAMHRAAPNKFSYTFRNLSRDAVFRLKTANFTSQTYTVRVLPKPLLVAYKAKVDYPGYINRKPETFEALTRLVVPVGSQISWTFTTRDADSLQVTTEDAYELALLRANQWELTHTVLKPDRFRIKPLNRHVIDSDHLDLVIDYIPDEHPLIQVERVDEDELQKNRFYTGLVSDDYGLTQLHFAYQIYNRELDETSKWFYENLSLDKTKTTQQFYHFFSSDSMNAVPGDQITYYFEIWDNDGIHGPKSSRSALFTMDLLTRSQMDSIARKTESTLTEQMSRMQKESQQLQREMEDFLRDMMQKNELDWRDRNQLKDFVEKQKQLQDEMQQLANEQDKLSEFNRENELVNERILEKQEQINKLIDELIPDDMRKMMEEIQALLEELNRDQMQEMLQNMQMTNEKFEQMLDRNLSLLKQLQVEKGIMDIINELDETSQALETLSEETIQEGMDENRVENELNSMSDVFDELMQTLDSLRKENDQLERPFKLDDTKAQEAGINQQLQEAGDKLQQGDKQESGKNQRNASGDMKDLSDQLAGMMMQSQKQQNAEDARTMRILLENIVRSSFMQEEILTTLGDLRPDDPAYVEVIRSQSQLRHTFRMVEDSLIALSKRQPMVQNFILNETETITRRMNEALEAMQDRKTKEALNGQQFSMMSLNNLGLMLAEALDKLEESMGMQSGMDGEESCSGSSQENSLQNMREMQEALAEQLKQMMEGKEDGMPQPGEDTQGMSEEIARMAAEQEAIRQQMQNYLDQLRREEGAGGSDLQEIIKEMDAFEEDLVNRRINQDLLKRQEDIIVRLLESERAEEERELDEERESNEFKGEILSNPSEFLEYKRLIEVQQDELRLSPLELQPYFRNKANTYFLRTNQTSDNE